MFVFVGSLAEIEAAAERLDKQMNTDLESDCEAVKNNPKIQSQRPQPRSTPATTTTNSNISGTGSSTMKTNNIQKKNDNRKHVSLENILHNFYNCCMFDLDNTPSSIRSLAQSQLDCKFKKCVRMTY